jgi:hypothetical protein
LLMAAGRAEHVLGTDNAPPNRQMWRSDAPRSCGDAPPVWCTVSLIITLKRDRSVVATGGQVGTQ